ncbi:reverse transcriptase-like protein [Elysia marginata]|uniref:Reverse transcriptase-like protein n=1 Tax=Elysia marginata TaxID=1093978 RepID=A0AAV4IXL6_9GAST|nr:reverse transcriptase-like protein [Elysia marginata]
MQAGRPDIAFLISHCMRGTGTHDQTGCSCQGLYKVNEIEFKISQYADDTTLFLDGSEESFTQCIGLLDEYKSYSGLKMNVEKTKVMWFGCPRPPETKYLPDLKLEWNPQQFTVLGIDFTTDLKDMTKIDLTKYLSNIKKDLQMWSKRNLTPFGKITVI